MAGWRDRQGEECCLHSKASLMLFVVTTLTHPPPCDGSHSSGFYLIDFSSLCFNCLQKKSHSVRFLSFNVGLVGFICVATCNLNVFIFIAA